MNKTQALNKFWSEATGLIAFEENAIPDSATLPYCTYQTITDSLNYAVFTQGNVWANTDSWETLDNVIDRLEAYINGGKIIRLNNGSMMICKGSPFAQRRTDDTGVKGYLINIQIEYFTEV